VFGLCLSKRIEGFGRRRMLRINRCLSGVFLTALLAGTASAQKRLTCQEALDPQKAMGIAFYFFSQYDGSTGTGSEFGGLTAGYNYLLAFRFPIGVETGVSLPAEPVNGPGICNDALELFDTVQATPTNVPTDSESTQPAKSDNPGLGIPGSLSIIGQHGDHDETWNIYGQQSQGAFARHRVRQRAVLGRACLATNTQPEG
jgi:hypothetical protein